MPIPLLAYFLVEALAFFLVAKAIGVGWALLAIFLLMIAGGAAASMGLRGALLDAEHARELGKQRLHEVDQREVRQTAQREHCEHSAIARRPRREPLLRSAHRHASSPPCLVSSSGRGRRSIRLIESVLATVSLAGLSVTPGMDRHKVNLRHMLGSAAASRPPQHPQHRTPLTARSG